MQKLVKNVNITSMYKQVGTYNITYNNIILAFGLKPHIDSYERLSVLFVWIINVLLATPSLSTFCPRKESYIAWT